ncbi:unnamed protein product [Cyprideis torosa]|uniref:Uncharacterized protein n=1 Tax=Cyprideis torosa TaxID=163714 RepID=A0A7R8WVB0_9CRUS|nr:unnamed protein product [Cyprideis torosa]CAG0909622.1 unnamed protein product [Cyprideis torosa]
MKFKGVGEAKAVSIITAIEIARRRLAQFEKKEEAINSSKDAYQYLLPYLSDLRREEFWVLYLNRANKVLSKEQISRGGITQTSVDARIIFRMAIERGAVAFIVAHNHPSGNVKPSEADKQLTQKIKEGAKLLDLSLLDHLIIAANTYFSFADEHLL